MEININIAKIHFKIGSNKCARSVNMDPPFHLLSMFFSMINRSQWYTFKETLDTAIFRSEIP